ncbi:hypothetical protein VQ643_11395 [Pseudomonas sp. F1_0610]|uniref:hypothetical protein n=1 Tax=Pseudomonas sp. F1_0610 TaxID=3114284 RepID=UPI0039C40315
MGFREFIRVFVREVKLYILPIFNTILSLFLVMLTHNYVKETWFAQFELYFSVVYILVGGFFPVYYYFKFFRVDQEKLAFWVQGTINSICDGYNSFHREEASELDIANEYLFRIREDITKLNKLPINNLKAHYLRDCYKELLLLLTVAEYDLITIDNKLDRIKTFNSDIRKLSVKLYRTPGSFVV